MRNFRKILICIGVAQTLCEAADDMRHEAEIPTRSLVTLRPEPRKTASVIIHDGKSAIPTRSWFAPLGIATAPSQSETEKTRDSRPTSYNEFCAIWHWRPQKNQMQDLRIVSCSLSSPYDPGSVTLCIGGQQICAQLGQKDPSRVTDRRTNAIVPTNETSSWQKQPVYLRNAFLASLGSPTETADAQRRFLGCNGAVCVTKDGAHYIRLHCAINSRIPGEDSCWIQRSWDVENASRQSENECVFRVYAVIWISRYDGNFFKVELVTIVEPSGERVSYVEARNAQHPNESDQNGQIERLKGFVTKLPSMEATNPLEPFNQLQRMINTAQSQYGSMGIEFPTNEKRTNEKSEIVYRVRLP